MAITLEQRPIISEGDVEVVSIDYTDNLDSGELLTGTPTIVEVTTTDLTLANKAVSTTSLVILGETVAAGMAVQFTIAGQQQGTVYRVRVTVSTTSTPARTLVRDILITVDVPVDSSVGSMAVSYSSLLERVGHFLFGLRSGFSTDQINDIEECIKDGLRRVYVAHTWSFFRPVTTITTTAPYATGTVTIASGVVTLVGGTFPSWAAVGVLKIDTDYYDVDTRDSNTQITLKDTTVTEAIALSYELGRPEYDLPTEFEAIEGDLTYEPGQSDFYPPLQQMDVGELLRLQQDDPYHDRPISYSIRTAEFDPTVGSRRRLALYPTPDESHVLKARMKLRPRMIDETNQYPVGGETLAQVILEACLSAAEQNYDEENKRHTEQFQEMLPLAIAADLEMTAPTHLGPDAPRGENADVVSRSVRMGSISLEGVEL